MKRKKRAKSKSDQRKLAGAARRAESRNKKGGAAPVLHSTTKKQARALQVQRGVTADGPR